MPTLIMMVEAESLRDYEVKYIGIIVKSEAVRRSHMVASLSIHFTLKASNNQPGGHTQMISASAAMRLK